MTSMKRRGQIDSGKGAELGTNLRLRTERPWKVERTEVEVPMGACEKQRQGTSSFRLWSAKSNEEAQKSFVPE